MSEKLEEKTRQLQKLQVLYISSCASYSLQVNSWETYMIKLPYAYQAMYETLRRKSLTIKSPGRDSMHIDLIPSGGMFESFLSS